MIPFNYKDSTIDEISSIPKGWNIDRLISLGNFSKGKNITKSDLVNNGFPCILYSQIYTKFDRIFNEVNSYIDEIKFLNSTKIKKGDFLFTSSGETVEDIGKCILYDGETNISIGGDIIVFSLLDSNKFDNKFLSYVFNADFFNYQKSSNSNGEIVVHIYEKQLREIKFTYPSYSEQKRISQYLDKKTSQINSLIKKVEKKIKLLKEQKTALINQYVTKGLDLNVEMKDSGVEGIGEIPKNWSLKKISHLVNFIGSGGTPKSNLKEYYENGEVNWLITGDLNDHQIYETSKKITLKALEDTSLKIYPQNSLVIAMYGATIGKLGILKVKSTVNQACCVLNFDTHQDVDFWFNSFIGNREYLISLGYGGGQPNISQETIKGLRLPSPPDKSEQILISKILKFQCKKINDLIEKHIKKKDLLREYHQSLISSVVTGKIRITESMI